MADFLDSFNKGKYSSATVQNDDKKTGKPELAASGVKVTEHQIVIDKNYSRKKLIRIGGIVIAIVVLALAGYLVMSIINKVDMQNFEGKTLAEAKAWAAKNSIEVDAQYEFNLTDNAEVVISQSVKAGESVSKGDTVQFKVSSGADPNEKITVPEFSTMTASQIQTWIDENKLTNTKISEENSDTVAKSGFISATYRDVTADKDNFKRKDYLTIAVSKGPSIATGDVTMTDLVGETKADAESWADTNGLTLVITTKTSAAVAADKVISQDIASGETVKSGGTVNIVVSGGTGIKVPSYKSVNMSDAQNAYSDFVVTLRQQYSSSVGYGKLISQSVSSGKYVLATDNKITVVYSIGKPYLGNLAGTSESELAAYFSNFNQKGANISYKVKYSDSDIAKGTVISTSKYSEYLSMKETITVIVSNGSKTTQGTNKSSNDTDIGGNGSALTEETSNQNQQNGGTVTNPQQSGMR